MTWKSSVMRVLLLGVVLILGACTTVDGPKQGLSSGAAPSNLGSVSLSDSALGTVATDLVSAIVQMDEFSPFSTTLQFSEPSIPFGFELINALKTTGYGIQRVAEDQGVNYVSYSRSEKVSEFDELVRTEFTVTIRNIRVARTFKTKGDFFVPDTPIEIYGAKPQRIVVSTDIYRQSIGAAEFPTGVSFFDRDGKAQSRYIRNVVNTDSVTNRLQGDVIQNQRALILAKASVFTKSQLEAQSNVTYRPSKQLVIRFRPGSLDLGQQNKMAIQQLNKNFSKSKHRYSITPCDQSNTLIWDGTEAMALQRGQRVRQELLTLGVPINSTRDESCFNEKYTNKLIKNSVVLTLESGSGFL